MNQETPETDAMLETDWHRLEEYSAPRSAYNRMTELCRTLERERNEAREIAAEACAMLAENGFETNYPPMPWDSDSSEND